MTPHHASDATLTLCRMAPVIPVLVIRDPAHAAPLARALVAGGLPVLEVTLRTPAALEVITEMARIPGAMVGAGTVLSPAVFHSEARQKIVQEREEIWFRSPCPAEMTVDFVASLQRALKARGLYVLPLTGQMDLPTRAALRRFQADRGLESDRLSLTAARELGLVTADLGKR